MNLTVKQFAEALGVSRETARVVATREPDVIRLKGRGSGKRVHLRIPPQVVTRVQRAMAA